jgi:hypothetical protein
MCRIFYATLADLRRAIGDSVPASAQRLLAATWKIAVRQEMNSTHIIEPMRLMLSSILNVPLTVVPASSA